jgi:drug/metabolite transporter (DMT)-like permease
MSAILYAVMVIFNKKASSITGLENSLGQLTAAFFTVSVFVAAKQGFAFHIEPGDWIPILVLGMVNTGIGCYFYFSSIGDLPVQTVSVCGYLEPLSAVVFSMAFLHERMTCLKVIGAILILGGAAFSELMPLRHKSNTVSIS